MTVVLNKSTKDTFSCLKIQIKILLVPFNHYCKKYHTNENIACSFFIVTNFEI